MQGRSSNVPRRTMRWACAAVLLGTCAGLGASASAQAPPDNVHWSVSVTSAGAPVKAGSDVTVEVNGSIDDGWHVYGLQQLPGGPTPLRLTLDANDTATAAGNPSESAPQRIHDTRFGLDTQFHTHALTLRLPVHVTPAAAGSRTIPISVRFQLCSEGECKPPRTVHLAAPIEVAPHA
jgi:Disulphide bond corrector protein DsbC